MKEPDFILTSQLRGEVDKMIGWEDCDGTLPAPWGKNFGPRTEPGGCARPKGHTGDCHPVPLALDTK